jgi:hypothetical protein
MALPADPAVSGARLTLGLCAARSVGVGRDRGRLCGTGPAPSMNVSCPTAFNLRGISVTVGVIMRSVFGLL